MFTRCALAANNGSNAEPAGDSHVHETSEGTICGRKKLKRTLGPNIKSHII